MKRQIILLLSIWLLLSVDSFADNTAKTKPTLDLAKKNFGSKIEGFKKVLEEFNVTYEKYLTKLESELKAKGELEQLLLIRKEKAEFRKGAQSGVLKFAKLQHLRTIYSKGRETRRDQIANDLKPVLIAYIGDLNEIRKAFTIEDKIDEALIVKKEEERIKVLMGDPKTAVFTLGIFSDPFNAVVVAKKSLPTEKKKVVKTSLKTYILKNKFSLYFDPPRKKTVTFLRDGTIGMGHNSSEDSWDIKRGELHLLNAGGEAMFIFSYDGPGKHLKPSSKPHRYKSRNGHLELIE